MNNHEAARIVMPAFAWLISDDPRAIALNPRQTTEIVAAARVLYVALGGTTTSFPVGPRP